MTSGSFNDLGGRLDEIRCLTALDPDRSANRAFKDARLSAALNRACLVLLSAHLEGFLEDLATEAIDYLVAGGALVERLPLLLRSLHAEEHIRRVEEVKDRKARASRIETLITSEASLWVNGNVLTAPMVRVKTICGEMSNPGSTEVRRFLELLGVDIRGHLDNAGKMSSLGRVDGLVGKRNAIAHGESTASATHVDIDVYVSAVTDLASEIDAAVAAAVRDACGTAALPW